MKIEILSVKEVKGLLRVEVEHDYGKDNLGLSLDAKYLGDDGQPKWKKEVQKLIKKKYGSRQKDKSLPEKQMFEEEWGTTFEMDENEEEVEV